MIGDDVWRHLGRSKYGKGLTRVMNGEWRDLCMEAIRDR